MMGAIVQPEYQMDIDPAHDAQAEGAHPQVSSPVRSEVRGDAHQLLGRAMAAGDGDDAAGALTSLLAAINHHPATAEPAFARAGALYRQLSRPQDAEAILLEGMCWFPSSGGLFSDYAAIADDMQNWTLAVRRYRLARARFP